MDILNRQGKPVSSIFLEKPFKFWHFIFLESLLLLFLLISNAHAAQVTLAWDDTDPSIAGYRVYYGASSGSYQVVIDVGNLTTYTISNLLDGTTYYFAAIAYDASGIESEYSNEVVFNGGGNGGGGNFPPGVTTLTFPYGTISTSTPTYIWNSVAGASWYYLWVNDSTGTKIQQWYPAEAAGCAGGSTNCSVTPTTALAEGAAAWYIQTWNSAGYGPWSSAMNFTVSPGTCTSAPPAATLVSPSGTIPTTAPTYTWDAVPCSTWYYLWVNDATGTRIQQWVTAEQAGCPNGTGACSFTPTTPFNNGAAQWWIQTWDNAGYGPWSSAMNFSVSP